MTKYLETKINSIEEAISSVVKGEGFASDAQRRAAFAQGYKAKGKKDKNEELDENGFVVGKVKMPKMKGGAKLQSKTNFDFRLFDPEDSPGSDKANDEMNREIVKASKMKDKATAMAHMNKIQRKHSKHGATDTEPREVISQVLNRVFGESVELDEGYESEVLKVLRDADIEGYFKNNKLYVSRRDARDAKKALEDSDEITKLPKMVMEDERMKKLTPRQRQALARVQAKPKSQVSLPKMPDFMKPKKEETEMDIVDTIRSIVEKKLDEASIYLDGHGEQDTGEGMKDFANLTKKLNLKFKNKLDRSGMGGTTVTGDAKSIEKMLQTMYGNDWKKMYKLKGQKFVDIDEKLDPVNKTAVKKKFDDRKDKDIDNDGDVDSTDKYLHTRRKAISKAIAKDKNEAYDIGKDYAQHTLDVTPGQDKKDIDKMLNVAYTKNQSMRESLAKVWGLDEGKSPFQKEEEKPLTKTMTGQKPTKVMVEPKMEKK